MIAASLYEKALQAYMDLGNFPEKVQELKVKIQEANEAALKTEYEIILAEARLPREEIDEYLRMYEGRETIEIFNIMSLDMNLIPSYEEAKQEAIEQAK